MNVYLAAPYIGRDVLVGYRSELASIGITVTSRWLDEQIEINKGSVGAAPAVDDLAAREHVRKDFADIDRAAVLVAFTGEYVGGLLTAEERLKGSMHSGGRHIETGYALAKHKHVIVVGAPENIFHRAVNVVPDWHSAVLALVQHSNRYSMEVSA